MRLLSGVFAMGAVAFCVLCAVAFTQARAQTARPRAAVYIKGNPKDRDILRAAVNNFLVRSGKYQMIAVDAIDVVAKEHLRQASSAVSEDQIAKMGEDAGAQYVCVVERVEYDGVSYVITSMVSVQSKVAEQSDMAELTLKARIIDVVEVQICAMLGMPPPKQAEAAIAAEPQPAPKPAASAPTATAAPAPKPAPAPAPPPPPKPKLTFTDSRDGKKYKTAEIGNQTWMAENLDYQTDNSWCYDCKEYGRLYDWNTAKTVCPSGWHLPSNREWEKMAAATGGASFAGIMLKATSGWSGINGKDAHGFSALPGGGRRADGKYYDAGKYGYWWTDSENDGGSAHNLCINYYRPDVYKRTADKGFGFSVRCLKDD